MTLMHPGNWHVRHVRVHELCLTPFLFLLSNQMNIETFLLWCWQKPRCKSHTFFLLFLSLFSVLQLQRTYCWEQYAYNWDTLLYIYIFPWVFKLLLIHLYRSHIWCINLMCLLLLWGVSAGKASWFSYCKMWQDVLGHKYFWHTAFDIPCVLVHTQYFPNILNS